MDGVALIERRLTADAIEEKGQESDLVFLGEGGVDGGEGPGVVLAHARGHHHAGDDDLGGGVAVAHAVDDGLEIFLGNGGIDAAEAIVAAEREQEDVDGLAEHPVDAAGATGGGFTAETGVHDPPADGRGAGRGGQGVEFVLKEGGVGVGGGAFETVAGGEAVAEADQRFGDGLGGAEGRGEAGHKQTEEGRETDRKRSKSGKETGHGLDFGGFVCFVVGPMSVQSILKVERLTKDYRTAAGPLTVLKEVSFDLTAGASLAIVGPSGSGKTTLLGLCAGLDRASGGTVTLAGSELGALDEDGRARVRNAHVGFVFQNFQLIPTLTAVENVLVPLELRGEGGAAVEAEAAALLGRVGLGARCDHYPVQLSGGEQQRVALARAFMNRPKILFCDEPTGNLDGDTAAAMVELVFGLNREKGTTLVLVTHDLELAKKCGRVIRLRSGAVVSDELLPANHAN